MAPKNLVDLVLIFRSVSFGGEVNDVIWARGWKLRCLSIQLPEVAQNSALDRFH